MAQAGFHGLLDHVALDTVVDVWGDILHVRQAPVLAVHGTADSRRNEAFPSRTGLLASEIANGGANESTLL